MKTIKSILGIITITAALAVQVQAQSVLTNGLIAYYPFTGNGSDQSGNGYNITNVNLSLTADRFGNSSSAVILSKPIFATNLLYEASASLRTLSEWVKISDYPGNTTALWEPKPNASFVNLFGSTIPDCCLASDGEFWLDNEIGGTAFFKISNLTNWVQIVVVYSGELDTAQVYCNGQLVPLERSVNQGPGFSLPSQQYQVLSIPNGPGDSGFSTNNLADDVRIYDRALSSDEVRQLYLAEAPEILNVQKAVFLNSPNLKVGTNYQIQASSDLANWTNCGSAFTATTNNWNSTNYWPVANWNQLFFRLQVAP